MILFDISASALGKTILRGEKLTFDNVLTAVELLVDYSRSVTFSLNVTGRTYNGTVTPNTWIDAISYNEFINGGRRPHLMLIEDFQIRLPTGTALFTGAKIDSRVYAGNEPQRNF